MNKCDLVNDLLPLYTEGLLNATSKGYVERHLKTCAECAKKAKELAEPLTEEEKLASIIPSHERQEEIKTVKRVKKKFSLIACITTVTAVFLCIVIAVPLAIWGHNTAMHYQELYDMLYPKNLQEMTVNSVNELEYDASAKEGEIIVQDTIAQDTHLRDYDFYLYLPDGYKTYANTPQNHQFINENTRDIITINTYPNENAAYTTLDSAYAGKLFSSLKDDKMLINAMNYDLNGVTVSSSESLIKEAGMVRRYRDAWARLVFAENERYSYLSDEVNFYYLTGNAFGITTYAFEMKVTPLNGRGEYRWLLYTMHGYMTLDIQTTEPLSAEEIAKIANSFNYHTYRISSFDSNIVWLSGWNAAEQSENLITLRAAGKNVATTKIVCVTETGTLWDGETQSYANTTTLAYRESTSWLGEEDDWISVYFYTQGNVYGCALIRVEQYDTGFTATVVKSLIFIDASPKSAADDMIKYAKKAYLTKQNMP